VNGIGAGGNLTTIRCRDEEEDRLARRARETLLNPARERKLDLRSSTFFDLAQHADGVLPVTLATSLSKLVAGSTDVLLVHGLPTQSHEADHQARHEARHERSAEGADLAHAVLALITRRLGHEFGYRQDTGGAVVQDIRPTRADARSQSGGSAEVDFLLHTEISFHDFRPDFVVLFCVHAPPQPPATRLAMLDATISQMDRKQLACLCEPRFSIGVADRFLAGGARNTRSVIAPLSGSSDRWSVRWHHSLRGLDTEAERARVAFQDAAHRVVHEVRLQPGDMIAFANDRCLHGRERFSARFDGTDRWLLRCYIARSATHDHDQSRDCRRPLPPSDITGLG
jgi:L-asparagine oxygenase